MCISSIFSWQMFCPDYEQIDNHTFPSILSSFLFLFFTILWLAFPVSRLEVVRLCCSYHCGLSLEAEASQWDRDYLEMMASSDAEPCSALIIGSILCCEAFSVPVQWSVQAPRGYWAGSPGVGATSGPLLSWGSGGPLCCSFHLYVSHMDLLFLWSSPWNGTGYICHTDSLEPRECCCHENHGAEETVCATTVAFVEVGLKQSFSRRVYIYLLASFHFSKGKLIFPYLFKSTVHMQYF